MHVHQRFAALRWFAAVETFEDADVQDVWQGGDGGLCGSPGVLAHQSLEALLS